SVIESELEAARVRGGRLGDRQALIEVAPESIVRDGHLFGRLRSLRERQRLETELEAPSRVARRDLEARQRRREPEPLDQRKLGLAQALLDSPSNHGPI